MTIRRFATAALAAFSLGAPLMFQQATAAEMTDTASAVLHEGVWTKKSFNAKGSWSIYQDGGKTFIKLSADFQTRNAPDLKLFLSPLAAAETTGANATNGSTLIAPLKSNRGEQVYEIPEGVDISTFKSVLIHCEQYSKLWAAANL